MKAPKPAASSARGNFVDGVHVDVGNHRTRVDIGEQRDLFAQFQGQRCVGPADDDIRMNAQTAQLRNAVLGGLGLQFAGGANSRDERYMRVEHVVAADLAAHLAKRFDERNVLDVAYGSPDFHDHDVRIVGLAHVVDAGLDLVGDVGNDLDGSAQKVAAPLAADHAVVDAAGRQVADRAEVFVDEALVVTKVQVGFGAVDGYKYFAVLEGTHGAGVHVDVWIQLHDRNLERPALEQAPDAGDADAFANAAEHAAGDENELARCAAGHADAVRVDGRLVPTWALEVIGRRAAPARASIPALGDSTP